MGSLSNELNHCSENNIVYWNKLRLFIGFTVMLSTLVFLLRLDTSMLAQVWLVALLA